MEPGGQAGRGPRWSLSTPCSKQGQLWGQTRLLTASSSSILKTSKDGGCTTSLSDLLQYWTVLREKTFPCIQPEVLISTDACGLLFSCCAPLRRAWLRFLDKLTVGVGSLLLGLQPSLLKAEQAPIPQQLLTGQVFQPLPGLVATPELAAICQGLSCTGGPKLDAVSRCGLARAEQRRG